MEKTAFDLAYKEYNDYRTSQNRDLVVESFLETLIPEVDEYFGSDPSIDPEEACQRVFEESGWEPFHYTLFLHLFSKESSTEFPLLHECLEEFQDFIENECPKMLLEVYENAS